MTARAAYVGGPGARFRSATLCAGREKEETHLGAGRKDLLRRLAPPSLATEHIRTRLVTCLSTPEGAQSILRAFTRDDIPADPDQIFLTSWGEWWGKDTIEKTLDKKLQDKWCLSKEEIEKQEGISA
ncbi:hypothetical protein C8R44DRAFT_47839 [Mycena epipterygia]|nr:hypothetical protein C8R44DRAFT_47839 [Mycena epipterygia]